MGKFTLSHEIDCDQDTFWSAFFDSSLNEELYLETLGYPMFEILEKSETDTQILRKLRAQPKWNMPGPVAKILGTGFNYVEEGAFNKSTKIWSWRQIPSNMADKIRIEGNMRVEPIADSKIRRILDVEVETHIYGIGGLLESTLKKSIHEEADSTAVYFSQYFANMLK